MRFSFSSSSTLALLLIVAGCVDKNNPVGSIPPQAPDPDVFYQPLASWTGGGSFGPLNAPEDVEPGYDGLIYVADTGNNRIVQFDEAGRPQDALEGVGAPTSVVQDRKLTIYAAGTTDTTINGTSYTLAALYRIEPVVVGNRLQPLAQARVTKLVYPFFIPERAGAFRAATDPQIRLTGVAVRGDNQIYVTRTGPNQNPGQAGGPDDAVLLFNFTADATRPNAYRGFIGELNAGATGLLAVNQPTGITTLATPPQRPALGSEADFVITQRGPVADYRALYVRQAITEEGILFTERQDFLPPAVRDSGARFLYDIRRFTRPEDVTYAYDSRYFFVVDAGRDSVYQFTFNGAEGVPAPASSSQKGLIRVSFGGTGSGPRQFNNPHGIGYLADSPFDSGPAGRRRILLVADTGNNRIATFRLSTDAPR